MIICPSCGDEDLEDDIMVEDGEEYKIKKCKTCGWYG